MMPNDIPNKKISEYVTDSRLLAASGSYISLVYNGCIARETERLMTT
jgi:hypothetical protein